MQILSLQQLCSAGMIISLYSYYMYPHINSALRLSLILDQDINYDQFDIHSVATFIKRFLRNIPEPIIPYDAVDEILRIRKCKIFP